jgi:hypothetical protein
MHIVQGGKRFLTCGTECRAAPSARTSSQETDVRLVPLATFLSLILPATAEEAGEPMPASVTVSTSYCITAPRNCTGPAVAVTEDKTYRRQL